MTSHDERITELEMRLAELDLLEARRKLLQLELRTALASAQLERSMGGAKENQKPNVNR